jgi:hypothetical protein
MAGTIADAVTAVLLFKMVIASKCLIEHIGSLSTTTLCMAAWSDGSSPFSTPQSCNQLGQKS